MDGRTDVVHVTEQRKATLRRVEMELDEADEMVRPFKHTLHNAETSPYLFTQVSQMEIEIQGMPQSIRTSYHSRVKSAKADLARYKKIARDLHTQASRAELLSNVSGSPFRDSVDDGSGNGVNSDRTRLLAGTALLEDGTRRLQDSQRIALETESLGAETLMVLRGQREQIENARDTVSFGSLTVLFVLWLTRAVCSCTKQTRRLTRQLERSSL